MSSETMIYLSYILSLIDQKLHQNHDSDMKLQSLQ